MDLPGLSGDRTADVQRKDCTQQRGNPHQLRKVPSAQGSVKLRASERHAVTLVEESGIDIGLAGIGKTLVAPSCTPTVADDEAAVGGISDTADAMAAANRRRHAGAELARGPRRGVPGLVHMARSQDPAIACR